MVALLRFFDASGAPSAPLAEERRPVDPLHRLVARVTFQYRVRRAQQLERLELSRRGHVGADAEVDEGLAVLDRVTGDLGLAFRLFLDQLNLQRFMPGREERPCFLPRNIWRS